VACQSQYPLKVPAPLIAVLGGLLATIVFETSHAKSLTFAFFAQNSKHLHHFFE
jgi:hypothetical protein